MSDVTCVPCPEAERTETHARVPSRCVKKIRPECRWSRALPQRCAEIDRGAARVGGELSLTEVVTVITSVHWWAELRERIELLLWSRNNEYDHLVCASHSSRRRLTAASSRNHKRFGAARCHRRAPPATTEMVKRTAHVTCHCPREIGHLRRSPRITLCRRADCPRSQLERSHAFHGRNNLRTR
jgi:hypothetical protein